jgi:hypothetical protein
MLNSGFSTSSSSAFGVADFFEITLELGTGLGVGGETVLVAESEEFDITIGSSSFKDCTRFNASINLLMFVPYSSFTLDTISWDSTLSFHHLFFNKVFQSHPIKENAN